jgi:hypothetical protein
MSKEPSIEIHNHMPMPRSLGRQRTWNASQMQTSDALGEEEKDLVIHNHIPDQQSLDPGQWLPDTENEPPSEDEALDPNIASGKPCPHCGGTGKLAASDEAGEPGEQPDVVDMAWRKHRATGDKGIRSLADMNAANRAAHRRSTRDDKPAKIRSLGDLNKYMKQHWGSKRA